MDAPISRCPGGDAVEFLGPAAGNLPTGRKALSVSQPRSRFYFRRRILEALLVLWVIAYVAGYFQDQQSSTAPLVTPTPVAASPSLR